LNQVNVHRGGGQAVGASLVCHSVTEAGAMVRSNERYRGQEPERVERHLDGLGVPDDDDRRACMSLGHVEDSPAAAHD
jgi:hypothetical protein